MLVGFVGLMGSGKGTAGDILRDKYNFTPESFAKPVKDAVAPIFGWNRSLLEGDTAASRAFREEPDAYWSKVFGRPYTPREALQRMGTECGRNQLHPDVWVHSLLKRVTYDQKDYVITDVRFPNEIVALQGIGATIIVVERGDKPAYWNEALKMNQFHNWNIGTDYQTLPFESGIHYSEWAWIGHPSLSVVIQNDGSVEELDKKIRNALQLAKPSV